MTTTLLQTKLYRPTPRPDLVPRARLRQQLVTGLWTGDAFARKLTLVAAPAGFGKTTLIADFGFSILDCGGEPKSKIQNLKSAWLALDAADNDPARFLRYVIAALQSALPEVGRESPPLLELGVLEEALAGLINELTAAGCPIILTLDDYHVITHADVEQLVSFLLDHQPPNLHLVIASRVDPALPLTRLRARGQLLELRTRDLRFTEAETAAFLTQTMGLDLPPAWIAALEERTEGWIAGLQLAALSLQSHDDPAAFIQAFSGSHRYIIDYLVDEVLCHQPPDIREFLVRTSILERFCDSLCDALLEAEGETAPDALSPSARILQTLERANLFLIPLDDQRQWYRYHHLFADSLCATLDAAQQAALHRRAAEWFAAHNLPVEAVQHARATGDLAFMAAMIERAVQQPSAWSGGHLGILVGWLDALPDALLDERPALTLHVSRAFYLSGRIPQAERLLERAIQALQGRDDAEARTLLAVADTYRGALAVIRGDTRGAIGWVEAGLARLPESALHARARAFDVLGTAYQHLGDTRQAERYFLQAGALAEAAGVAYLAINARCEAAQMQITQGRLTEAEETCQAALRVSSTPIPPQGLAWTFLGEIARTRNELATAEQHLQQGLALAQQGGLTDDVVMALGFLAWVKQNQGDAESAQQLFAQFVHLVHTYQVAWLLERAVAHRARLDLVQGRLAAATQWAHAYEELRAAQPVGYVRDVEDLTLVRVLLAEGETQRARAVLEEIAAQTEPGGRMRRVIEVKLLTALVLQREGRAAEALHALREAVTAAAPEHWRRLFLDEGAALSALLPHARDAAPAFVDELQALLPSAPSPTPTPLPIPGETLSEREVEILRLLAEGHSNQEIGQALYIGVGTVKWYLTHLYDKLDVSNRTQAVARARELGLLG